LYANGNTIIGGLSGARVPINVFAGNWRYRLNTAKNFKKFSWLTEKSGKYFFVCEKFPEKTFLGKSVHALTHKPELFPTTQKPD